MLVISIVSTIILLTIAIVLTAKFSFNKMVKKEIQHLLSSVKASDQIIKKDDIAHLPTPIQNWLSHSGVIGKKVMNTVDIKQKASLRLAKDKPWMRVKAKQFVALHEPSFIWHADIKAAPFFHIAGRDCYVGGRGHMLIKVLSLLTVANAKGNEIDQGSLLRYLAESVWYPTAALEGYITWEEIDEHTAKATMSYEGIEASGVFTFNEKSEPIRFKAERYMEREGDYSLETWLITMREFRSFDGIAVPSRGEITWKLAEGDFTWFTFEVTDLHYD
ncbi:hypothetical protein LC040_18455 [Bacillus tianshenii]|nr:hypothetical protein LC040_18455 [Bacillus tianshenii]